MVDSLCSNSLNGWAQTEEEKQRMLIPELTTITLSMLAAGRGSDRTVDMDRRQLSASYCHCHALHQECYMAKITVKGIHFNAFLTTLHQMGDVISIRCLFYGFGSGHVVSVFFVCAS